MSSVSTPPIRTRPACVLRLYTLQHRGQEAAGMASVDHGVAHVHKGKGLVPAVFNEDNLSTLKGVRDRSHPIQHHGRHRPAQRPAARHRDD